MKTHKKSDRKQGAQNKADRKTKREKIRRSSDTQSVMAEMNIRSGRLNKKK